MKPGETGPRNSILWDRSGRRIEVLALSRLIGFALAFVVHGLCGANDRPLHPRLSTCY